MRLKLKQIEAFYAVARYSHFTLAAESMHITQPALSTLIRGLEQELDIILFDRTTRMVQLTEAGESFYPVAERVLSDLEQAITNSRDLSALKKGRVSIACSTVMASLDLPIIIDNFNKEFPGLKIEIHDEVEQNLQALVASGEVNFAIATKGELDAKIKQTRISTDQLALFVRKDHPLAIQPEVRWQQLIAEPHIMLPRASPLRLIVDRTAAKLNIVLKPAYEVRFASTVLAFIRENLGVAILPNNATTHSRSNEIISIPLICPTVTRDICLLTQTQHSLSPAAAKFKDYVADWFLSS